jgi:hypothetical protein
MFAVDGTAGRSKLRGMKLFRRSLYCLAPLMVGACERAKTPPTTDTTTRAPSVPSDSSAVSPPIAVWDSSAGPVLLIATDAPTRAFVLVPDPANSAASLASIPHPASVTLLGRNGSVQSAELPQVTDTGACPSATLSAAPPPRAWNVGFIGGVVAPVALDSLESLARNDSLALTTGVIRLSSALPNDSAGRFSGLPFVVRGLWRFTVPQGPQVVAATLMRQINQEATPLQERTFLVAERSPTDSMLTTVYSERSYGDEETIETRDVLAAILLGPTRNAAIVLSRDFGEATAYALIERGNDGKWRARWNSPRRHC